MDPFVWGCKKKILFPTGFYPHMYKAKGVTARKKKKKIKFPRRNRK